MGNTKYRFEDGILKIKFNFDEVQTTLFKESYGYPAEIDNPDYDENNPESLKTITNDMPLEVFWALYHANEMDNRMKAQHKSKKQSELEAECCNIVNVTPTEDETL